ncbi:patatin [Haematococcus lacustris]|uniref:Patatin n=1 Tax=Haematococcus lacustris TaxID=44745 RepID=A0A6A0AJR1_HAELA|nr:patatin [Haematococcus lacustris]
MPSLPRPPPRYVGPAALHPAVQAFQQGTLGFAFSGGGFFFPYHLGCVIQLKDMGILDQRTPLAGASCGSIIASCVNAGLDLHALVGELLQFANDCRSGF